MARCRACTGRDGTRGRAIVRPPARAWSSPPRERRPAGRGPRRGAPRTAARRPRPCPPRRVRPARRAARRRP